MLKKETDYFFSDTLTPHHHKDCSYVRENKLKSRSGVYTIYPDKVKGTMTYCDMTTDGRGWTVCFIVISV